MLGMWSAGTSLRFLPFQKVWKVLCLWVNGPLGEGLPTKVHTLWQIQ